MASSHGRAGEFAELIRQDERGKMAVTAIESALRVPPVAEKRVIEPGENAIFRTGHPGFPHPPAVHRGYPDPPDAT
jgi:hypothetical protein